MPDRTASGSSPRSMNRAFRPTRIPIEMPVSYATERRLVALSTKNSPRSRISSSTLRITRRFSVTRDPIWLFTPWACGTASTAARVSARTLSYGWCTKIAPSPGSQRG